MPVRILKKRVEFVKYFIPTLAYELHCLDRPSKRTEK